jgi:hypothetical protein
VFDNSVIEQDIMVLRSEKIWSCDRINFWSIIFFL